MLLKKYFFGVLIVIAALSFSCKEESKNVIKVGAIFAKTGPASFLGAPEARTAQMLVDNINKAGGVNGKKIKLIIKDSGGDPGKATSFANQLIREDKVFAIIGPSTSGESLSIKNICEKSKTLLISCAAAESIVNPLAKYVFKTPQKDSHAAIKIFMTMKKMGIKNVGVISGNTGFGKAGKQQIEKLAPKHGINILISEVYDKKSTDLTGVLTKVKAKKVQAVINWSIVPAQSIVAKNMKQLNMNVPLFQSHGFGNVKYAKSAGAAGEGIIFPSGRLLVAELLPESNKQKELLVKYKKDYEAKFNEDVSTFGGHAYDAVLILVEGLKKAGSADAEKVRIAIENIKDFPGTGGIFNFSATDHNGLGLDAFTMMTVKDGKFVPYKK